MPEIYGFTVDGRDYQYDYNSLANKPTADRLVPASEVNPYPVALVDTGSGIEWADFSLLEIPTYRQSGAGEDRGKVLTVKSVGTGLSWETPSSGSELPEYGFDTIGNYLTVSGNGSPHLEWQYVHAVPDYDSSDDRGKVLTISLCGGQIRWETPSGGGSSIPGYESEDAGKVLAVNNSGDGIEWATPSGGGNIPGYDSEDAGKMLAVNESGDGLLWAIPSGGGGSELPNYDASDDDGKVLTVSQDYDGLTWDYVPSELPAYDQYEAGKVLAVNSGGNGIEWQEFNAVPYYDSGNAGSILMVDSQGESIFWHEFKELPSYSSSENGYYLTVEDDGSGGSDLAWRSISPSDVLPPYDESEDDGKVLMIYQCSISWQPLSSAAQ